VTDEPIEHPEPLSAREALLCIRVELGDVHGDTDLWHLRDRIEAMVLRGLNQTAPPNFELTDQLADRLAEAHGVLMDAKIGGKVPTDRVNEVLALPPDLEAMVERRLGHRADKIHEE